MPLQGTARKSQLAAASACDVSAGPSRASFRCGAALTLSPEPFRQPSWTEQGKKSGLIEAREIGWAGRTFREIHTRKAEESVGVRLVSPHLHNRGRGHHRLDLHKITGGVGGWRKTSAAPTRGRADSRGVLRVLPSSATPGRPSTPFGVHDSLSLSTSPAKLSFFFYVYVHR